MPHAHQPDAPLIVHMRQHSVHLAGQMPLGKDEIQAREHIDVALDHLALRAHLAGQLQQDALDFLALLGLPLFQVVAQLHHRHGFDKQRRARAALVVHQAWHKLPVFLLDGDAVAAVAHSDNAFLQVLGKAGSMHHAVQLFTHALVGLLDVAADIGQLRAGMVGQFFLADDRAGDRILQLAEGLQMAGQPRNARRVVAVGHQGAAGGAGCAQAFGHAQQRLGIERRALGRQRQVRAHIGKADQRAVAQVGQDHLRLLGFLQRFVHLRKVGQRRKLFAGLAAHIGDGK